MLYPKKNLVPDTSRVTKTLLTYAGMNLYEWSPLSGFILTSTEYFTVKAPYEFEVVATSNNRGAMILLPAKPNTIYKPYCETNGDVHLFYLDSSKTLIGQTYDTISKNLTGVTPAGTTYIIFALTNRGLGAGVYTFRNWQLEEVANASSSATPFEPYTLINKPAVLMSENIIDTNPSKWEFGSINGGGILADSTSVVRYKEFIPVEPNTTYTFSSTNDIGVVGVHEMPSKTYGTRISYSGLSGVNAVKQVTTNANTRFLLISLSSGIGDTSTPLKNNFQIEKGIKATPYKPYKWGNKPATLQPKKNVFDKKTAGFETGSINSADGLPSSNNLLFVIRTKGYIPVEPNTSYIQNKIKDGFRFIQLYGYDEKLNYIGRLPWTYDDNKAVSTTSSQMRYVKVQYNNDNNAYVTPKEDIALFDNTFQLEKGSVQTSYEPYTLVNKPAPLYTKNLFNINGGEIVNKSGTTTGRHYSVYATDNPNRVLHYWLTPVKSNTAYTTSWIKPNMSVALWEIDANGIVNYDTGWKNDKFGWTMRNDTKFVMFVVRKLPDPSATTKADVLDLGLQFEEGSTATAYEPYKLTNKPAVLYPQKNLLPKLSNEWTQNGNVGEVTFVGDYEIKFTPVGTFRYVRYTLPVTIGKTYRLSGEVTGNTSTSAIRVFKSNDLSSGNIVAKLGAGETFTVDSSYQGVINFVLSNGEQVVPTTIKKWQLEEVTSSATPATPFEPLKLGNKK